MLGLMKATVLAVAVKARKHPAMFRCSWENKGPGAMVKESIFNRKGATGHRIVSLCHAAAIYVTLCSDFLRIFVGDGCLIMTEGQLKSTGYTVQETWAIPYALQLYWKPVFVMIYDAKVVSEMIISLLARLSMNDNPEFVEHQLVAWTKFFLEPCVKTKTNLMMPSDWSRILHKMVAATGHFDVNLVEEVMSKVPNLSDKRRRQVRRIMDITLSESLCAVDDSMSGSPSLKVLLQEGSPAGWWRGYVARPQVADRGLIADQKPPYACREARAESVSSKLILLCHTVTPPHGG
ncbi:unnamed protein product [Nippostrongylus brasiliensis]|uniref:MULE domain-containing protein n=1 Tax=Nippostrongylus brasiliensis TaxID=27835 RepID=A0A0N4XWY2_NIPBR|nr:unnamed protein product [Nippostrongylus brasiliensis]